MRVGSSNHLIWQADSSLCAEILSSQGGVDECESGGRVDWLHIDVQQLLRRPSPLAVIERHTEPGPPTLHSSQLTLKHEYRVMQLNQQASIGHTKPVIEINTLYATTVGKGN
jgi:hypothetical protein